jgi:recombination protein RecA
MGRKKGGKNLSKESKQKVLQGLQEAKEGKIEKVNLLELLEKEHKIELTKEQQERKDRLNTVLREINKEYQDPEMIKFANKELPKESIPFYNKYLDPFLGGGGIYGNYVIFWGTEGVGKTTLAFLQIASIQKQGKIACYIDLEHTLDLERAKLFGVNPDELVLIENAETAEQAMDIVITLAKSKTIDLIVIDSIQAMTPKEENVEGKAEKTRSMEEAEIAALAKKMGKFLRRTASSIYKAKCSVILIGQARTGGIGTFITRDELTGGRAIKFWSMLTVYLRKGQGSDAPTERIETEDLDEKGKKIKETKKVGFDCVLIINKTKKGNSKPELSELHLPYYFSKGFLND